MSDNNALEDASIQAKETGEVSDLKHTYLHDYEEVLPCNTDVADTDMKSSSDGHVTSQEKSSLPRAPDTNMARIKSEFIDHHHKRVLVQDYLPKDVVTDLQIEAGEIPDPDASADAHTDGPPTKKLKVRGRNKQRHIDKGAPADQRLCPTIMQDTTCAFGDRCKFSHDVKSFMDKKLPDVGEKCVNYEIFGRCSYGVSCRFAKNHITADYKNMVNEELWQKMKNANHTANNLPKPLQKLLWKRKYDFQKADKAVNLSREKKFEKLAELRKEYHPKQCETPATNAVLTDSTEVTDSTVTKDVSNGTDITDIKQLTPDLSDNSLAVDSTSIGPIETNLGVEGLETSPKAELNTPSVIAMDETSSTTIEPKVTEDSTNSATHTLCTAKIFDINGRMAGSQHKINVLDMEGIKFRTGEKKTITFKDKLYLAPLTTVGNLPFRRICKSLGADITCGEMALVTNLLKGQMSEWSLLKRHHTEDIFGVQLCGSYPDTMTRCAQMLTETCDIDFIDLNLGCPIELMYRRGEGSAMMGKRAKLQQIVHGMQTIMGDTPLTIKIRTGIMDGKSIAHELIPHMRDWGVDMVTLHGRSREQRYTKSADWDYISKCADVAKPMPLFGNGDIMSYEDANLHREQSGVSGIMIARGALIKPWLFTEIKEQRHWDISSSERLDILRGYCNAGMEHWGSDTQGIATTRRFLLEWLSFLHRYIPVGLLEQVPQRIHDKPPYYFGRDDLETLMASANASDWVRISEMLLGPVPDNFAFIPKHKAASYR